MTVRVFFGMWINKLGTETATPYYPKVNMPVAVYLSSTSRAKGQLIVKHNLVGREANINIRLNARTLAGREVAIALLRMRTAMMILSEIGEGAKVVSLPAVKKSRLGWSQLKFSRCHIFFDVSFKLPLFIKRAKLGTLTAITGPSKSGKWFRGHWMMIESQMVHIRHCHITETSWIDYT